MEFYNPEQTAAAIGNVSASTIRNWCKVYAAILSNGANPTAGRERRLSEQDVATLQQVKLLRDNRMTADEIVTTLQQAEAQAAARHITIEATPPPTPTAQEGHSEAALLPVALSAMTGRQDATDKRVDALQQAIATLEQRQSERTDALVTGLLIGGAVVLIVVALVMGMG